MAQCHGIVGIDEAALNTFISRGYDSTRNSVFHDTVSVAHLRLGHLESVEYDIATAPRVLFMAPPVDSPAGSHASFQLIVDRALITLHYAGTRPPTTIEGGVRAAASLTADATGSLTPKLAGVLVDIPNEPLLGDIMTEVLVPYLERYTSEELLEPIRIPPLAYGRVELSNPTVNTGDGRLTVTTAIAPAVAGPAPPIHWPDGRIFIAADFELVNKLVSEMTSNVTETGTWSKRIKFGGFGQTTIKADYTATLTGLTLQPARNPQQIAGTAALTVDIHCYAKNVFSVRGTGSTVVEVTFKAVLVDNSLAVQFVELEEFTLNVDIKKVPKWLDKEVSGFIAANVRALRAPLSAVLAAQPPIQVGGLPSFDLDLRDTKLRIQVTEPTVATTDAPDGRILLIASGLPDVRPTP